MCWLCALLQICAIRIILSRIIIETFPVDHHSNHWLKCPSWSTNHLHNALEFIKHNTFHIVILICFGSFFVPQKSFKSMLSVLSVKWSLKRKYSRREIRREHRQQAPCEGNNTLFMHVQSILVVATVWEIRNCVHFHGNVYSRTTLPWPQ